MNTGSIAFRSAPAENGSSADQITQGRDHAPGLGQVDGLASDRRPPPVRCACILVLIEKTSTSACACPSPVATAARRRPRTPCCPPPRGRPAVADQRRAEELPRVYTGRSMRGTKSSCATDSRSLSAYARRRPRPPGRSSTHRGSGALHSASPRRCPGLHPLGHLLPAGRLPGLERSGLPAETPAQREIDVARGVGDRGQVHGDVVKHVAENRPQELGLRMIGLAQQLQALVPHPASSGCAPTSSSALPALST